MLTRRIHKDAIPVIILAGFLGAGKTTVLNHILASAAGARIAVIVNDFGSVNIDSMLIAARTDRKLELTNGCICCGVDGDELEETLEMAIKTKPDAVIIEASGIAEPDELARLIIVSSNEKVGYGGLVYLVDAVNYHETIQRHKRITRHIAAADLVVLTKVEKVTDASSRELIEELSKSTKAPIVPVKNGELAPELLFDIPERISTQLSLLEQDEESHSHLHDAYQSMTFETARPIDPEKFKTIMDQPPEGIYRIKGIVYFGVAGYEQKFVLQAVGGRWDMYAEEWSEGDQPATTLVLIGAGFDENKTRKDFEAAIGESGVMIDIQRYTKN